MRDIPLSGQGLLVVCVILVGGAAACTRWALDCRVIDAGFWFEPVTYQSARLGRAVTPEEMAAIVGVAHSELADAFGGWSIRFSNRRDAKYRVRVVQQLRDMRVRWDSANCIGAVCGRCWSTASRLAWNEPRSLL